MSCCLPPPAFIEAVAGPIPALSSGDATGGTVLSRDGAALARFNLADGARNSALGAVDALRQAGLAVEIVSADTGAAVTAIADELHIAHYSGDVLPAGFLSPFMVAIAMALSSIIVVLNALRLGWGGYHRYRPAPALRPMAALT